MPQTFPCSQCQKPLQTPDGMEGRMVRCPGCQGTMAVPSLAARTAPPPVLPVPRPAPAPQHIVPAPPVPPSPIPPPVLPPAGHWEVVEAPAAAPEALAFDYDEPAPSGSPNPYQVNTSALDGSWKTVQSGLQLMGIGTIVRVFGLVGYLLGTIFSVVSGIPEFMILVVLVFCGLLFIAFALDAVGMFMCSSTPQETGLHGLVLAAAICWVTILGSIATPFLFLLYLRGLGQYFGNKALARDALSLLITIAVVIPLFVLIMGCFGVAVSGPGGMGAIVGLLMLILFIGVLILYSIFYRLLTTARSTITRERIRTRTA